MGRGLVAISVAGAPACGGDDTSAVDTGDTSGSLTSSDPSSSGAVDVSTSNADTSGGTTSSATTEVDTSSSSNDSSSTGTPNTAPIAVDDVYAMTMLTTPLVVDVPSGVLANDSDPDGDVITVDDFDAASEHGGIVEMNPDGSFTYTPAVGFWGEDGFAYTLSDGQGGTAQGQVRLVVAPTTISLGAVATGTGGFALVGTLAGDQTGYAVASGDVNGDAMADVIAGSHTADVIANGEGRAYVAFGKPDGTEVAASDLVMGIGGFVIDGLADGDQTGYAVGFAGDVNGDGLGDVIVGAPAADTIADDEGRAYVVFGRTDTAPVDLASLEADAGGFVISGIAANDLAGSAVGGNADVNGDGLGDVLVGAPLANAFGASDAGRTFVVFGKADTGPVDLAAVALGTGGFVIEGAAAGDHSGDAVAGLGDVNGDGLDDMVVGAPWADPNGGQSGRTFVVFGKTDGMPVDLGDVIAQTGGFAIDGIAGLDQSGDTVASAGDVDGDGSCDIVLGAPGAENDMNLQGRAFVVLGKADTTLVELTDIAAGNGGFSLDGELEGDLAAWSVGGGRDVDGDGLADVVVGAQSGDFAGTLSGRSYVVFGTARPASQSLAQAAMGVGGFAIDGEQAGDVSGWAVAAGADISGDGLGDVVIGAYDAPASTNVGRAYAVFGGDFFARVVQLGTDGDDSIDGTAEGDTLIGGRGNDVLRSYGGLDVIYGGAGDDEIALVSENLFRIDGGGGVDSLVLDGADLTLDLPAFPEITLQGIERVDLTGGGDNSLFLDLRDLRALSDTSNTLTVDGDLGDQVVADLSGSNLVDGGSVDGYRIWSNGVLTLAVADAVESFVDLAP